MNLNKVYIIGRLTQDPETRATPAGQSVTTLRLATNRTWNDASGQRKESVEYHTVIAWQRLGEIAAKYLRKGGLVLIEGRIQTRSWTGNDNVKRYFTEIIAENLQLGPRPAGYSQEPISDIKPKQSFNSAPDKPQEPEIPIINADEPVNPPMMVEEDETKIKEEDLPF
ncbi:MAG: hypothetical protein A3G02_02425 [Candidatus Yanofskybacteria bacterium RIFCSPLOWO2_12_FULL_44_13b]|uniref:Single-stranded DNA-binding protein n=2 Tax=Candidatus Yanofskyibacteriota TaxID=1752733 RepID=A0A1F8H295_9BACT|nr:MAG: Single-stranded DNA-binding protein [Candidatus Yanofskybacteria bacterium GW2011_GWB1_45_11]OGN18503.1 MAG: hypothetical protein A3F50_02030 [Candidatus Yanofskybacteria bacterium RIFCSPHIGHO2_12_FULL_44_29b]OGN26455.1 MAG: hypothetical protein A3B12_02915 [Candidatus Yanofskybacteria bacterium RIFCSPLOWO2_01_FULL_44_88]OGN31400.1 MAG: hypothetical protein A3I96_01020 [Candidatus Yanofskybacteria bacterium RIFCSPLOWO2_02_FULL_44_18]OGN34606.1 MAG: hypothetical protein A3G02_02425 [Cand